MDKNFNKLVEEADKLRDRNKGIRDKTTESNSSTGNKSTELGSADIKSKELGSTELVNESNKLVIGSKDNFVIIKKIDKLLDIYISNEMMFAQFVKEGAVYKDDRGEEIISDKAIALHKARKDSISDLVKVKLNLQGVMVGDSSVHVIINTPSEREELVNIIERLEELNKRLELNGDDNVYGKNRVEGLT